MPIQILPARLANQIAAGEVVERPASVIKELVENALDSGADNIEIDVHKGGIKLIRIRDNGSGIGKDELGLALSRHATSKVLTIDDLENITSLGFRGEALASISSVSRLTLTSKPKAQTEAWQAYAEGRDMAVSIIPAAHPDGTSVEVSDLFFNTPARRKFLRSDKTEFYHIDELLKRMALSRFEVAFTLKHNGKVIRQLRQCQTEADQDRRIALICGRQVAAQMIRVSFDYEGVELFGWLATGQGCRTQNDVQYSYVNGRMMRDKLINHGIRQAYGNLLRDDQYPTYVLYIRVDPRQIDVNVHPAKHEVRFHQARLVHDFIVEVLGQTLAQAQNTENVAPLVMPYGQPDLQAAPQTDLKQSPQPSQNHLLVDEPMVDHHANQVNESQASYQVPHQGAFRVDKPSYQELKHYRQALTAFSTPLADDKKLTAVPTDPADLIEPARPTVPAGQRLNNERSRDQGLAVASQATNQPLSPKESGLCLTVVDKTYAVYQYQQKLFLIDLRRLDGLNAQEKYAKGLAGQPLLLPIKMAVDKERSKLLIRRKAELKFVGIDVERLDRHVVVRKVPFMIRDRDVNLACEGLFGYLATLDDQPESVIRQQCLAWLTQHYVSQPAYDVAAASRLINLMCFVMDEAALLAQYAIGFDVSTLVVGLQQQFEQQFEQQVAPQVEQQVEPQTTIAVCDDQET